MQNHLKTTIHQHPTMGSKQATQAKTPANAVSPVAQQIELKMNPVERDLEYKCLELLFSDDPVQPQKQLTVYMKFDKDENKICIMDEELTLVDEIHYRGAPRLDEYRQALKDLAKKPRFAKFETSVLPPFEAKCTISYEESDLKRIQQELKTELATWTTFNELTSQRIRQESEYTAALKAQGTTRSSVLLDMYHYSLEIGQKNYSMLSSKHKLIAQKFVY